jgi:hypothetical protein
VNINNPTTFSTPDLTLATSNSSGTAGALRADDTVLVFDATLPDAITFGQSGAAGSGTTASYRNHAHAMVASPLQDIRCAVYADGTQSLANASDVAIAFNQESFDTDSMHDNTTNNTRITFTTAGTYVITTNIAFTANATGYRGISIRLNGSTTLNQLRFRAFSTPDNMLMSSTIYTFDADDYVEAVCYQNSGGALTTQPYGIYGTGIRAVKVVG